MLRLPDVSVLERGDGDGSGEAEGDGVLPGHVDTYEAGEGADERGGSDSGQGADLDRDDAQGWVDYADARARFLSAKVALDNRFAEDPDYATAPFRYQAELLRSGAKAAQGLSPRFRGAFEDSAVIDTKRGIDALQELAREHAQAQGASWMEGLVENAVCDLLQAPDEHTRAAILKALDIGLSAARRKGFKSAEEILALRRRAAEGYGESRLSILSDDEQIAALDRATTIDEDGTASRAKTRSFVDFIPDARIAMLRSEAQERKIVNDRAAAIDAVRQQFQAQRAAEDASREAEEATLKDLLGQQSIITAHDIARNGKLLPATRLHMMALAERVTQPDPPAATSHATTLHLLVDIRRPDGDPERIADAGPIYDAYTNGQLNRSDFEWTRQELADAATPDGAMLATRKADFLESVRPQILFLDPSMGAADPKGEEHLYWLEYWINLKIEAYEKAGNDPFDLFDPSKPDYIGKLEMLAAFQTTSPDRSLDSSERGDIQIQPLAPPPAPAREIPTIPGTDIPDEGRPEDAPTPKPNFDLEPGLKGTMPNEDIDLQMWRIPPVDLPPGAPPPPEAQPIRG